jgi:2-dehydropantoate 2-reductase
MVGAGGIGGYFGGRLAQNGADVTFLVREKRRQQLESEGLRIESVYGNAAIRVACITAEDLRPEYDVVVLACKAYDLAPSIESAAPGVAADGCVVPLLNGIAHMRILNERFGPSRVLGGTAKIAVTLTDDGMVRHLNDWRSITIGEQAGAVTDRVREFVAAFAAPSVEARAVDNIPQEMWSKLVHLATAASMTCLMRASIGDVVRTRDGALLLTRMFDLAAEIATRNGYPPSAAFRANYRQLFSDPQSAYTTSMLRDIEAGKRTEGDHIIGFMLDQAGALGFRAPLLEICYANLQAYENRRAAGQLPVQRAC